MCLTNWMWFQSFCIVCTFIFIVESDSCKYALIFFDVLSHELNNFYYKKFFICQEKYIMQHNTCKEILQRYEKSTVKSGILHGERQYSRIYFELKCNGFYISK